MPNPTKKPSVFEDVVTTLLLGEEDEKQAPQPVPEPILEDVTLSEAPVVSEASAMPEVEETPVVPEAVPYEDGYRTNMLGEKVPVLDVLPTEPVAPIHETQEEAPAPIYDEKVSEPTPEMTTSAAFDLRQAFIYDAVLRRPKYPFRYGQ